MSDQTARTVLAQGRHLRLVVEEGWEYVERNAATGIAVIVGLTPENRLLLVEQYRRPVHGSVLELPAGLAGDVPGHETEALADAARRELLEETGYEADDMTALAAGPPSVGVTSEVVTFFRASGLRKTGAGGGDGSESIVVHEVDLDSVDAWLGERMRQGALVDPKVFAGLYLLTGP
jgi:ADP-ribose pyrophosphatase